MKNIKELMGLEEAKAKKMRGDDPCWDTHQMVGMKKGKGGKPVPNCVPKNEEVEAVAEGVSAQDKNISVGHYVQTAAGVEGVVKHISPDGKKLTIWNRKRQADHRVDITKAEKIPGIARRKMAEQGVAEGSEQIDELNKDTLYSYNNKANADIEKKHKSLGQLMRKGDAADANKAAHQLHRRLAGTERAEKRLNKEAVEFVAELDNRTRENDEIERRNNEPEAIARREKEHQINLKKAGPKIRKLLRLPEPKEDDDKVNEAKVETAAQVTKHFEKGQSTPSGVPKWVAEPLKSKKKTPQKEEADAELMGAKPSGGKKLAAKFEKAFKALGQPRKVQCMTVGQVSSCEETEQEFNTMFTEAMKKKVEDKPSNKNMKKGEKLSGKQEPITISPEIEKKGVA